ncbi:glycine cleavage system aminomethyltransferase GcvT [Leifsonia sp. ZF2019]|uniref:glycine cleavage system aminomethyltransferase GcvT n=1 Tax=Leifsonia sp. ZF2019 TaxID=2781978 RepID=UPI001CC0C814|nr:glycine cleavage system aminomethyltransferase GcvT [Leifsonia sp. ZF2019]UAJ78206.1 glycine cleavage system aminomethyltransferase GcvT [Leifsonia sp. ZF2019]
MTSQDDRPHDGGRTSPLHDAHAAAGASFTDFAGWQMPVRYSSDLAEHHAVRTAAGLFDLSHMGEIVLIGPEAGEALDYALAGKLSALAIDQAKYSLLLSRAGGIVDDLVVYRTGDDRFMVVANAGNRDVVAEELRERTAPFDVEVYDESDDIALIAVQGPASLSILLATEGFTVEGGDIAERLTALKYYWSVPAEFEGHQVLIARTGYTGEDGFELYLAPDEARTLWDALLEAGTEQGLVPAGLASRDTLRLEAGMPLYGHELGLDTKPASAGLGRVVNLAKDTDFIGRAASEDGPHPDARVLVGLTGQGKRAARAGYPVVAAAPDGADEEVGVVTSGALSPTIGVPIAMAYVAPRFARPGTELHVDVRGTRLPFTVTALPFYRRKTDSPRKDG